MKTAIVYASVHHGNTKKLVDAVAAAYDDITVIDATKQPAGNLEEYERVGFASGIYFSKLHKSVLSFAKECLPEGKDVFFLYTAGAAGKGKTVSIEAIAAEKSANILGEYGCLGFNTYGPFKLIGGIAKGHPSDEDIKKAVEFYGAL